jgi:multicomponent Na+:H+ antiporter subunit C
MFSWLTGEVVALLLFFIGLLGLIVRKNMMFTVIASGIMNTAVILFFVSMNSSYRHVPPMMAETVAGAADPVPQALMITSVVIGLSVQAVCLVLVMTQFSENGTLDWVVAKQIRDRAQFAELKDTIVTAGYHSKRS